MKKQFDVAIIGFGSFGQFIASTLPETITSIIIDPTIHNNRTMKDVTSCRCIVLSVPFEQMETVLRDLSPNISPGTLLIDVCSVKVKPIRLMRKILPKHAKILMTHPLFGPQSATATTAGHSIIVCNEVTQQGENVLKYCENSLGLKV